jgi:ribonuclease HI
MIASEQRKKSLTKSPVPSRPGWTPPPVGVVKINIDAVMSKTIGHGSIAAVARDDQGNFVAASARVLPRCTNAQTLEALACREAMDLAQDIGAHNVITSLDHGTLGVYMHIVHEILASKSSFVSLVFGFKSRVLNKEAHNLARSVICDDQRRRLWLI